MDDDFNQTDMNQEDENLTEEEKEERKRRQRGEETFHDVREGGQERDEQEENPEGEE